LKIKSTAYTVFDVIQKTITYIDFQYWLNNIEISKQLDLRSHPGVDRKPEILCHIRKLHLCD